MMVVVCMVVMGRTGALGLSAVSQAPTLGLYSLPRIVLFHEAATCPVCTQISIWFGVSCVFSSPGCAVDHEFL